MSVNFGPEFAHKPQQLQPQASEDPPMRAACDMMLCSQPFAWMEHEIAAEPTVDKPAENRQDIKPDKQEPIKVLPSHRHLAFLFDGFNESMPTRLVPHRTSISLIVAARQPQVLVWDRVSRSWPSAGLIPNSRPLGRRLSSSKRSICPTSLPNRTVSRTRIERTIHPNQVDRDPKPKQLYQPNLWVIEVIRSHLWLTSVRSCHRHCAGRF